MAVPKVSTCSPRLDFQGTMSPWICICMCSELWGKQCTDIFMKGKPSTLSPCIFQAALGRMQTGTWDEQGQDFLSTQYNMGRNSRFAMGWNIIVSVIDKKNTEFPNARKQNTELEIYVLVGWISKKDGSHLAVHESWREKLLVKRGAGEQCLENSVFGNELPNRKNNLQACCLITHWAIYRALLEEILCPLGEVLWIVLQCWAPDALWNVCASWSWQLCKTAFSFAVEWWALISFNDH